MFKQSDFLFTAETTPDLSTNLPKSAAKIDPLVGLADAVNITDSPNCQTKLSSLLVASEVKQKGLDVILQLTGRDRNRIAIESQLLGALSIDVNKVLCLTGDQPAANGPKAVNEYNGVGLIQLATHMSRGTITDGSQIDCPKPIYPGAADDLYQHQSKPEAIDVLMSKIDQGACFVQTQYCFDYEVIRSYSELLLSKGKTKAWKVLIGMGPLQSAKQADWMRNNLWGVHISDDIVTRLESSSSPAQTGIEICKELIEQIMPLPGIDGAHLMGPNCEQPAAKIISAFR